MANGFLLLPVVLSFIGPTHTVVNLSGTTSYNDKVNHNDDISDNKKSDSNSSPITSDTTKTSTNL